MLSKRELEKVEKYLGVDVARQLVELELATVSDEPIENVLLVLFDIAAELGLKTKELQRMIRKHAKRIEFDDPPPPLPGEEPTPPPFQRGMTTWTAVADTQDHVVQVGRNVMIGPDGVEMPVDFVGRPLSGEWELTLTSYSDQPIRLNRIVGHDVVIPNHAIIRIRGGIGERTYAEISALRARGLLGVSARRP